MHVEAGKSFGTAEANENERRWDDNKIERKNQDPTNHYDKSRMGLNFEIGPDGKIHPLGYQQKSLEVRLMDRLAELGWHPFKADSKIQPWMLSKRWNVAVEAGVGLYRTKDTRRDPTVGDWDDEYIYHYRRWTLAPTKLEVSFSYIF